jgi:hypothetical protein
MGPVASDLEPQLRLPHFSPTSVDFGNDGVSQIFTFPSGLAEAIHSPSGLKATLSTQLVWPCKVRICFVVQFPTFTVASVLPQASTGSGGNVIFVWENGTSKI